MQTRRLILSIKAVLIWCLSARCAAQVFVSNTAAANATTVRPTQSLLPPAARPPQQTFSTLQAVPSSGAASGVDSNKPTLTPATVCFDDELEYVEKCYRFISFNVTWHEAESICLTRHGHLASVASLLKNNWIVQNMASESWIGLQRLGTRNNSQLGFLPNFNAPARTFLPNKLNYGNQSCFYLRRSALSVEMSTLFFLSTGVWQDDYCYAKHYAVCERDPQLPRGGRVELNYQRTNKLGQLVIQLRHNVDDLRREVGYREEAMHEKFALEGLWTWFKALAALTVLSVLLLSLAISWLVIQLRNKHIITLPSAMYTFGSGGNGADYAARRRVTNADGNFHRLSESSSRITLNSDEYLANVDEQALPTVAHTNGPSIITTVAASASPRYQKRDVNNADIVNAAKRY